MIDRLALGGIFTLPLLDALTVPQDATQPGIYGDVSGLVVGTSIVGLAFMLAGYGHLLRAARRWRSATRRGYGGRTVALVLADRKGNTGYLLQGGQAYSLVSQERRQVLLNGRLAQVGLLLGAGIWISATFTLGALMAGQMIPPVRGLAPWTLLPLAVPSPRWFSIR